MLRGPMNPHLRIDRVGALIAAVQTGKNMSNYMPWSKDPKSADDDLISDNDFEKVRELAGKVENIDGYNLSTKRTVASKPDSMLKSKSGGHVVPASPGGRNKQLTLEQRRERLRSMKHGK